MVIVDAIGKACPLPIIELARAARGCPPGATLELLATDHAVKADLEAWCAATGHQVVTFREEQGVFRAEIRLRGDPVGPG